MSKKKEIKKSKNAKALFDKSNKNKKSELENLFVRREIRENLSDEIYLENAKLIADGFDKIKRNKKARAAQVADAKQILQDFYDFYALRGEVKIVHPSPKNRQYYARTLGISARFKYFPMPVSGGKTKFRINKSTKTVDVIGERVRRKLILFPSYVEFAKNSDAEIKKVMAKIKKHIVSSKNKFFTMKIKSGEHETHWATTRHNTPEEQEVLLRQKIAEYQFKYARDIKDWLRGVVMYSFENQDENLPADRTYEEEQKKKKKKRKKTKRERARAK